MFLDPNSYPKDRTSVSICMSRIALDSASGESLKRVLLEIAERMPLGIYIYWLLGGYMLPTTFYGNQKQPLSFSMFPK